MNYVEQLIAERADDLVVENILAKSGSNIDSFGEFYIFEGQNIDNYKLFKKTINEIEDDYSDFNHYYKRKRYKDAVEVGKRIIKKLNDLEAKIKESEDTSLTAMCGSLMYLGQNVIISMSAIVTSAATGFAINKVTNMFLGGRSSLFFDQASVGSAKLFATLTGLMQAVQAVKGIISDIKTVNTRINKGDKNARAYNLMKANMLEAISSYRVAVKNCVICAQEYAREQK